MPAYVVAIRVCPTCHRSESVMVPEDEFVDSMGEPVALYEGSEGFTGSELDLSAPEEPG